MLRSQLEGQSALVEAFLDRLSLGRIVHAYMIVGPEGSGKRTLAAYLSKAVLCEGKYSPCGQCRGCRLTLTDNHPDALAYGPEGRSLGVATVRKIIEDLSVRAYYGRRTVVIEDGEKMTSQAQNALLKILEEPPEGTVFFLLVRDANRMLPTIRSRCQLMRMGLLTPEQAAAVLEKRGISREMALEAAEFAGGVVGQALRMAEDKGFIERMEKAKRIMAGVQGGLDPFGLAELMGEKKDMGPMLDALMVLCHRDMVEGSPRARDWLAALLKAKRGLDQNLGTQMVAETLFLEMSEDTKWQS